MLRRTRSAALMLLVALASGGSYACTFSPFDPCPETDDVEDVGQMDNIWDLQTVNNKALPYKSSLKPQSLVGARITFQTDNFERGGKCSDIRKSYGRAIMHVDYLENGVVKSKEAAGRFFHDHRDNTTSISALKYQLPLVRNNLKGSIFFASASALEDEEGGKYFWVDPGISLQFFRTVGPTEPIRSNRMPAEVCSISSGASTC